MPASVRLDLNGVVKGRTVDDALSLMSGDGFVSAGGDLAARGEITVALPGGGTVALIQGALATSGTDRRRWVRAGRPQHHLIDPRTGNPSLSPWQQVTVCAATCVGADVAAKAAFLLGPAGPAWLDARAPPGAVPHGGRPGGRQSILAAQPRTARSVHLTSNPVDWYAARAAGLTAYVLLSAGVVLGLTMASHRVFARWPRFGVEDIHRFVGLLVGTFVAIHVVAVAIDAWLPFSLASLIVPFTTRYRPIWVGLGIAAAELLVALAVTNHYRRRLTYRFWRRAHYLNFAVWTGATLHGLGSGTDRSSPWLLTTFAAAAAAVSAAVVWRVGRKRTGTRIGVLACLAAVVAAAVVVGIGRGPLRFKPNPWNAPRFTETLTGHIAQLNGTTRGIVSMAGEGQGHQRVLDSSRSPDRPPQAPQDLLSDGVPPERRALQRHRDRGTRDRLRRRLPPPHRRATRRLRQLAAERELGSRRRRYHRRPVGNPTEARLESPPGVSILSRLRSSLFEALSRPLLAAPYNWMHEQRHCGGGEHDG